MLLGPASQRHGNKLWSIIDPQLEGIAAGSGYPVKRAHNSRFVILANSLLIKKDLTPCGFGCVFFTCDVRYSVRLVSRVTPAQEVVASMFAVSGRADRNAFLCMLWIYLW
ncbi:hypothetical protein BH18ACI4_BH18ACI4_15520 [soil metagenome]